jgi:hypothetical protein
MSVTIILRTATCVNSEHLDLRLLDRISFRTPPSHVLDGLKMRVNASSIIRSSMYLGANIIQALLDNFDRTDWRVFTRRIDYLCHQINNAPGQNSNISEMESRLTGIMDVRHLLGLFYASTNVSFDCSLHP